MFKSTIPFLPFDVIATIVEIYIKDNAKSCQCLQNAKALSVISRSFLHLCRRHLFSSIHIKISRHSDHLYTVETFGRLLLKTPDIARYIRKLDICVVEPRIKSTCFFDQVSRQLTRLQSLTISNFYFRLMDWNCVSSSMRRALLTLMHLPTLTHLDLIRTENFLASDLITCSNLKHLSVDELWIVDKEDGASPLCHKPMQLQVFDLSLRGTEDLKLLAGRSDGRPILDFTGLEKIVINFGLIDAAVPIRESVRKSQQLRDIHLRVTDSCFRAMELAKMVTPSLETLSRVCLEMTVFGSLSADPLAGLCDELEHILGKNKLESLDIEIGVLANNDDCQISDDWARLEKILLLQPGWPVLKHVSLVIIIYIIPFREEDAFERAVKSLLTTHFTGLRSSKNLNFRFSVREEMV